MESMGTRLLRTFGETDSLQWTVGADWRRNQQRYLEETWDSQGGLAWDTLYGVPRGRLDDVGALTDVMLPVSDTVSVNIGGRIDYCQATLDMMDPIVSQSDYTAFTPRFAENSHALGMAYVTSKKKLTEETSLNGGIAFAMRNPDLTELYNFEAFVPQYRFGNTFNDGLSTLRPEKNLQLDLGLARQTKKVSYGVRGFYSTIHDYILPSPCYLAQIPPYADATTLLGRNFSYFPASQRADLGTPSENADTCQANYVYVNVDQVSMLGGDLYGDYEVREGISVFGNMSYVYAVNNTPVAVLSDPPYYSTDIQLVHLGVSDGIPGIYPLSGNVGIRFFEPKDDIWSVSFSAKMVRAQDHVAVTLAEVPAPGYTTFALRGYYRVRKNVRVSLDIDNLFNRAYVEPGSLAIIGPDGKPTFVEEPGISALMGVEARF
jgi:outer membrane receptor protein involved in Fe transport